MAKDKKNKPKVYSAGKNCLKCGSGNKLANHKDRLSCGKCGYSESKSVK
ncbi:MAG: 30S ribosomal protein S27ae [Candidatus Micrarchaeota archaeon]|nr:30S ribosomal protein S27ae [Candidatus Micrarchaeota archaeon]